MSKYDYIEDPLVREAMEQYRDKIELKKNHELDISSYKVDKPWGWEIWMEINQHYTMKLICMKKGNKSSMQLHEKKVETNFVIQGEATVLLEDETGKMVSHDYKVGQGWCVPLGRKHRVIAKDDYIAVECSTSHLNDVVRFEDDTGRASGKIEEEHKNG